MQVIHQFFGFCSTPSITSQNLIPGIQKFDFPEISVSDELLEDLKTLEHPRNFVLGKRMESFFEIAIKHSTRYELIASNIQIIQEKKTLGELDFLVYDNELKKHLHIELVYKLYIYDPEFSSEIEKWIGPNRRDSFQAKLNRLENHQFPLLKREETKAYLDNFNLNSIEIEQQLCFKAKLFLPEKKKKNLLLINKDCITGNWFSRFEFGEKDWKENLFHSPQKKDWSADPSRNQEWVTYHKLMENIRGLFEKKKSPLVWMKTENSYDSFFVVWW